MTDREVSSNEVIPTETMSWRRESPRDSELFITTALPCLKSIHPVWLSSQHFSSAGQGVATDAFAGVSIANDSLRQQQMAGDSSNNPTRTSLINLWNIIGE
jgi:hypothetical protein